MTFRESADAVEDGSVTSASATSTGERGGQVVVDDEAEETPRAAAEDTYGRALTKGEDPVRLYLKEIGKVPLLTAAQEVQIGRRIEVGQKLRRGEMPADDVIVLPEGGELEAKAIRPVVLAFERIRRLARKIATL